MKKIIKKLFNKFGIEINRLQPNLDDSSQVIAAMKKVNINVIFDIGANVGQFSSEIRSKGYTGKIISFEPLTSAREILSKEAVRDRNWIIHDRVAIGNQNGFVDINISKNSYSSSILPMLKTHLDAAPNSEYIGVEKTPIITLDSIADSYLDQNSNCFLKIDTQGYETQVLNGAPKTLAKAKGILCELSLVKLYNGQDLWKDKIARFEKEGFVLWSLQRGFTDNNNGRTLQMNGIFLRI